MYRIVLNFKDGTVINGMSGLTKEECIRRIDEFLGKYPEFEKENVVKFSYERVDN